MKFSWCRMKLLQLTILLFSSLILVYSDSEDYYWKDYFGEIPDDAFPGGKDRNFKQTYVGQVYIPEHGVLPAMIYEGQNAVTACKNGIHVTDIFVRILCSNHPDKLSWVPTTAAKLHNDFSNSTDFVVGGTENGKILNIGRVSYQGQVIVGKVCSYDVGNAALYFPYRGEEVTAGSYEVLTYSNTY